MAASVLAAIVFIKKEILMNILIASDIHGSAYFCSKLVERYREQKAEKLILLGDVLYHGPRNDLPKDYSPKEVISLLNPLAHEIMCVKGNCESDVDGMVLDFPVDAENALIFTDEKCLYLTHGHKIREDISKLNCILVNGHTHVPLCEEKDGYLHINPGSVSIPKEGSCHSYICFDGKKFVWKDVETGKAYMEKEI